VIKVAVPLRQDRLNLDLRAEVAEKYAVLCQTLAVQGKGVRENRIAQLGKLVQRKIPQVRNNRSELFVLRGHLISP
jgi:hypothetical protein